MENKEQTKSDQVTIKIMRDGPIVVSGSFILNYKDNSKVEKRSFASLCRCGESNDMPFCDGYHRKIGFEADE